MKSAKKFSTIFIIFMLKTTLKTIVSSLFDKISRHIERVFNLSRKNRKKRRISEEDFNNRMYFKCGSGPFCQRHWEYLTKNKFPCPLSRQQESKKALANGGAKTIAAPAPLKILRREIDTIAVDFCLAMQHMKMYSFAELPIAVKNECQNILAMADEYILAKTNSNSTHNIISIRVFGIAEDMDYISGQICTLLLDVPCGNVVLNTWEVIKNWRNAPKNFVPFLKILYRAAKNCRDALAIVLKFLEKEEIKLFFDFQNACESLGRFYFSSSLDYFKLRVSFIKQNFAKLNAILSEKGCSHVKD